MKVTCACIRRWYKENWEGSNNLVSGRRKVYVITSR